MEGKNKKGLSKIEAGFLSTGIVGLAVFLQGMILLYSPVRVDARKGVVEIQKSCEYVRFSKAGWVTHRTIDRFSMNGVDLNIGQFGGKWHGDTGC